MDFITAPQPERYSRRKTITLGVFESALLTADFLNRNVRVDSLIQRLTDRKVVRGNEARLVEDEIFLLTNKVSSLFMKEPVCLDIKLDRPLCIVGDLLGNHGKLVQMFDKLGHPSEQRYLFLGNYVNRGIRSMELVTLLFAYKVKYPQNILMLRGNHDCHCISYHYGFLHECRKRFSQSLWKTIVNVFNCLPAAAIVEDAIFCMHSGLIRDIPLTIGNSHKELLHYMSISIDRPTAIWSNAALTQLTWSEPVYDSRGWKPHPGGKGYFFGEEQVTEFCDRFGFQQVIRSNDVMKSGYEFAAGGRLLTICSVPHLTRAFRNTGAVVHLSIQQREQLIVGRIKLLELNTLQRTGRPNLVSMTVRDSLEHRSGGSNECEANEQLRTQQTLSENVDQQSIATETLSMSTVSLGLDYVDLNSKDSFDYFARRSTLSVPATPVRHFTFRGSSP